MVALIITYITRTKFILITNSCNLVVYMLVEKILNVASSNFVKSSKLNLNMLIYFLTNNKSKQLIFKLSKKY